MAKKASKKEIELELTSEEKKQLKGNEEALRQLLLSKAVLASAEKYEFTPEEAEEMEYLFKNAKSKYYIDKKIEGKVNVNEEEVTRLYTENKGQFDAQGIAFSQAKEIIQRDLINQQINTLENEELLNTINEMDNNVELTKEDILFSKGNPEVIRSMVMNKIVDEKIAKDGFEETAKEELGILYNNVKANFYLDIEVRKNVIVTHEEIVNLYEAEKGKLGDVTPNSAYNQIANGLLNNKTIAERNALVNRISEEYKVEDLVKENL